MRTPHLRRLARTALAVAASCAAGITTQAHASGFGLREGDTDWMATDFAGDTAKAYDASTVWSNPAGMVRLNQNEIDGSINGIFPSSTFSGANFMAPGVPTPGTTGKNVAQSVATAGLYAVWNLSPDFKLGFAADAPYGQRIDNGIDFVGRYQSLVSSISDEQFTISGAYRINQQWSIGGGPVLDVLSARLTQAIATPLSAVAGDAYGDVHGTDVSAGFNLGVMYQPTPDLRFGVDYRSRIQHDISGTQSVGVPAAYTSALFGLAGQIIAAELAAQNSPASTKLTLPDSVTIGGYWQATPQLALLSDASWTDWSLLQTINIVPTSAFAAPTSLQENWRNTYSISVGANYQLTRTLMLQGGGGFDQSPVTDSNRTSRIPDSNRYEIAIGAQYQVLPNLTLQAAYAHIFFASAEITSVSSTTSGTLVGKYSTSADTASLGVKYRF
ncbi:MAG TPA: outer membrane protein transport protein [Rhodopila sp.]|nr:outer membrane protein transport protein [Rhodopila sp.]